MRPRLRHQTSLKRLKSSKCRRKSWRCADSSKCRRLRMRSSSSRIQRSARTWWVWQSSKSFSQTITLPIAWLSTKLVRSRASSSRSTNWQLSSGSCTTRLLLQWRKLRKNKISLSPISRVLSLECPKRLTKYRIYSRTASCTRVRPTSRRRSTNAKRSRSSSRIVLSS